MTKPACISRKEAVNQHYESQWEGFTEEDVLRRVDNLKSVIDQIISQLTLGYNARILDIGSGPGIIPLRLAQVFERGSDIKIFGIDISEIAIKLGNKVIAKRALSDSIRLIRGDAENLPFQDSSFDAVVSNATINLLPHKERGFDEIAGITKEGGRIVIADCIVKESRRCCKSDESNDRLWSACVAGAPTKKEFQEFARRAELEVLESTDLTEEVSRLVENKLWEWPEFIEYGLEYYVFGMRKSG